MVLKINGELKWLKLSAAALLSVGMLAACGDGEDDDVNVINPPGNEDTDDETDVDVDLDDEDDNDGN